MGETKFQLTVYQILKQSSHSTIFGSFINYVKPLVSSPNTSKEHVSSSEQSADEDNVSHFSLYTDNSYELFLEQEFFSSESAYDIHSL